jgi:hypothetical protein
MEGDVQMENDGRNDFDFLIGAWKVHHRRLKERLKGSTQWVEFESKMVKWSKITADSCQWEQAFSEDSAKTWETNSIWEFVRI